MMGPMTGISGPTTGRFVVCGKGPATGLWVESDMGGFWGPELRAAGFAPDLGIMLSAYHEARGWDSETGKPSREKLLALGLEDVAKDLWD
jgi:aldehyde:ferredoxin oxidoreductase